MPEGPIMSVSGLLTKPLEVPTSVASATPQPRLVKAAHEFEAALMKELLSPLSASSGAFGGEDASDGDSSSALGSFAQEALGKALSERGGFGIATSIIRQLSGKQHNAPQSGATAPIQAGNHSGTPSVLKPLRRNDSNSPAQRLQ
jgi:Rod binding domain-containing protein